MPNAFQLSGNIIFLKPNELIHAVMVDTYGNAIQIFNNAL